MPGAGGCKTCRQKKTDQGAALQDGTGFASFRNPTNENPATRAGSYCARCNSVQLAAARETETSESEAEERKGRGFWDCLLLIHDDIVEA